MEPAGLGVPASQRPGRVSQGALPLPELQPPSSPRMLPSAFEAGRAILALDFMVFTLRLIHIFAIHKQLGPKIIVVERMVSPTGAGGVAGETRPPAGSG